MGTKVVRAGASEPPHAPELNTHPDPGPAHDMKVTGRPSPWPAKSSARPSFEGSITPQMRAPMGHGTVSHPLFEGSNRPSFEGCYLYFRLPCHTNPLSTTLGFGGLFECERLHSLATDPFIVVGGKRSIGSREPGQRIAGRPSTTFEA